MISMEKLKDILMTWVEGSNSIFLGSIGSGLLKRLINVLRGRISSAGRAEPEIIEDDVTITIRGLKSRTAHLDLTLSGDERRVEDKEGSGIEK